MKKPKKKTSEEQEEPRSRHRRTKLPTPALELEDSKDLDSDIYREVGREVLEERLEPVAWARALGESKGSREDALSNYVRYRTKGLRRERDRALNRESVMAQRMVGNFRDFNSEPISYHAPYTEERGVMKFVEAFFWHTIAVVGTVGCLLAVGLVWPKLGVYLTWRMALGLTLFMQAIPIAAWWFGHRAEKTLSYERVARMAAILAISSSLLFGVKLLSHPFDTGGLGLYRKEVREASKLVQFPGEVETLAEEEDDQSLELAER